MGNVRKRPGRTSMSRDGDVSDRDGKHNSIYIRRQGSTDSFPSYGTKDDNTALHHCTEDSFNCLPIYKVPEKHKQEEGKKEGNHEVGDEVLKQEQKRRKTNKNISDKST